ncbi:hypothetical protein EVAR_79920_1 [Eumeta japonica]|uniref:Uncharacterized protein n=1 Tax=Eumeta variegata TaxID=151549 RepID=A0A4C1TZG2_EUMVA|nr:hypothetical protein EVAR_79920_1 [Eumeta japonica]
MTELFAKAKINQLHYVFPFSFTLPDLTLGISIVLQKNMIGLITLNAAILHGNVYVRASQTVRRDALGRRDIVPWASHVDATKSNEPQGTLGSAVRIVTNVPKLVLKLVNIFEG